MWSLLHTMAIWCKLNVGRITFYNDYGPGGIGYQAMGGKPTNVAHSERTCVANPEGSDDKELLIYLTVNNTYKWAIMMILSNT